jgi:hypothetical protein
MMAGNDRLAAARERGSAFAEESEMRRRDRCARSGLACLALLALASAATAQTVAATRDPQAMAAVDRMAAAIAGAKALHVRGEIEWDVLQPDGQAITFGGMRDLTFARPDRLRASVDLREGVRRELYYDGKQITLHDADAGVYATLPRSGPVGDVAVFLGEQFGIPIALAEFLAPDLGARLDAEIAAASFVGRATVDGVECDHVALRVPVGGMQLWIGAKDGMPRRIAIRYELADGVPQFRARLTEWNLSPRVSDETFAFEAPKGAEKIAFAAPGPAPKQEGSR